MAQHRPISPARAAHSDIAKAKGVSSSATVFPGRNCPDLSGQVAGAGAGETCSLSSALGGEWRDEARAKGVVPSWPEVKILNISGESGQTAIAPSIETTQNETYPIARPMFIYASGQRPPRVETYIRWMLSREGQEIVEQSGYVPLPKEQIVALQ